MRRSTMPEKHALPNGQRLDEYEVVRVLGVGGFGITYLAFDHQLDGPVALKEYFPRAIAARTNRQRVVAVSDQQRELFAWGRRRFVQEAQMVHRFRHTNVVRVHRYVEANDTAYIVMEYVEGESLEAILAPHRTLPAIQWWSWMDRLVDGLAHVHGQGYLHRDIKPSNIVIRAADQQPCLIDFGSARVATGERTHTQVLTPRYAPIEQYSNQALQGPHTDIYGLAAVSYQVLTGTPPPSAPDRVLNDQYEPLARRVAGADASWLAAIDHGLKVRPEERPATVTAWRELWSPGPPDDAHQRPEAARRPGSEEGTTDGSVLTAPGLWLPFIAAVVALTMVIYLAG